MSIIEKFYEFYLKICRKNFYIYNSEMFRVISLESTKSTLIDVLISFLKIPFRSFKLYVKKNELILPQIGVIVTYKCNLNCEGCAAWIPYNDSRENPGPSNTQIIQDLESFFESADFCYRIILGGGEPFLNRNLGQIIEFLFEKYSNKFNIFSIVSNGTVIPDKNTLKILGSNNYKNRIQIQISNYGNKSKKVLKSLDKHNINYILNSEDIEWIEMGEPIPRNRDPKVNTSLFNICDEKLRCNVINDGFFYLCGIDGGLCSFGLKKRKKYEFVDLRNNDSYYTRKRKIINLKRIDCISACDYCDMQLKKTYKKKKEI